MEVERLLPDAEFVLQAEDLESLRLVVGVADERLVGLPNGLGVLGADDRYRGSKGAPRAGALHVGPHLRPPALI